jgi:hypothetical protein
MSDAATSPSPAVYQLRVVMVGISPLIWRRLLIPADTTIAGLHTVLQTAFGWGGEHLHRFVIHGTEYGISYVGGPGFRDDVRKIGLGELGLRLGERFTYEYNYFAAWACDLRVERITRAQPGRTYPRCVVPWSQSILPGTAWPYQVDDAHWNKRCPFLAYSGRPRIPAHSPNSRAALP